MEEVIRFTCNAGDNACAVKNNKLQAMGAGRSLTRSGGNPSEKKVACEGHNLKTKKYGGMSLDHYKLEG